MNYQTGNKPDGTAYSERPDEDSFLLEIGEYDIIEIFIICLAFALWFYSLHKLYSAWKNTLNFSEASLHKPPGSSHWDALIQWILAIVQV